MNMIGNTITATSAQPSSARRAFVVDDHQLILDSLCSLLHVLDPQLWIQTARSLEDALPLLCVDLGSNDVVFLDLALRDARGFDALEAVRSKTPHVRIAVVSGDEEAGRIRECFRRGAAAFIPKSLGSEELADALTSFLRDGAWFPAHSLEATGDGPLWSQRHIDIIRLIEQGLSTKEIAAALSISPDTVKWHLAEMFNRFGVRKRAALVARARADRVVG